MNKKTLALIIVASLGLTALLYLYTQPRSNSNQEISNEADLSYEKCQEMSGSTIRENFPPVCITKDGRTVTKAITQEEEEELIEDIDTSEWIDFESEIVNISLSSPAGWGRPEISSTSSKDQLVFDNDFTITKGVYYTDNRDRVLSFSEFIEQNTPNRRIVTNYEVDGLDVKRASYDYSSAERAELIIFPPNQYDEMISIFFHYPKNDIAEIREYFGVLDSIEILPESRNSVTPTGSENMSSCMITGCSNEICAEEEVITTCEYKEEYSCYESATCERQENGECGWTMTNKLQSCLDDN